MRVRHHGVQTLDRQVVKMHLVSPEHEEPWLVHGLTVPMLVDMDKELITNLGVDIFQIIFSVGIKVFLAVQIYMVLKMELVDAELQVEEEFGDFILVQ